MDSRPVLTAEQARRGAVEQFRNRPLSTPARVSHSDSSCRSGGCSLGINVRIDCISTCSAAASVRSVSGKPS